MAKRVKRGQWTPWETFAVALVVVITGVVIFLYRGGGPTSLSHPPLAAPKSTSVKYPQLGLVAPSTTTTVKPRTTSPSSSSTTSTTTTSTTTTKKSKTKTVTPSTIRTSALAVVLPTSVPRSSSTTSAPTTTTTAKKPTTPTTPTTPTITWPSPAAISYGTALSATQLDATAPVAGTFTYTPGAGTVLKVGSQTLSVKFTPNDTTDYNTATATTTLGVDPAADTITWAKPAAITYGTALSGTQLDATAPVAGTFAYTPAAGTVPAAGTQTLSVKFTPTDTDYQSATDTTTLTVNKATSTITWAKPAAIAAGTALSGTQLDATASVPGTFAYTPKAGTVPTAGETTTLSVKFTPTDGTDYTTATATTSVTVDAKTTPAITWAAPAEITYGTALSATQLDATAPVAGTFAYTPAAGAVPAAGTDTLSVTFTPTDTAAYATATATTTLAVKQVTPTVTWAEPAAITAGTALGATQLDATASVPGTFAYTPTSGTVLEAGTDTLSVKFTPTSDDYASVTATTTITVTAVVTPTTITPTTLLP